MGRHSVVLSFPPRGPRHRHPTAFIGSHVLLLACRRLSARARTGQAIQLTISFAIRQGELALSPAEPHVTTLAAKPTTVGFVIDQRVQLIVCEKAIGKRQPSLGAELTPECGPRVIDARASKASLDGCGGHQPCSSRKQRSIEPMGRGGRLLACGSLKLRRNLVKLLRPLALRKAARSASRPPCP